MHSTSRAVLEKLLKEARVNIAPGAPGHNLFGSSKPVAPMSAAARQAASTGVARAPAKPVTDVSRGAHALGAHVAPQPMPFRAPGAPLDFSGKTAALHELTKMAFFDELSKIAMNLPPMHPRSAGTGSIGGAAPAGRPRPLQAKSPTPISDSVINAPSTQAASGMLPMHPKSKTAFAHALRQLSAQMGG